MATIITILYSTMYSTYICGLLIKRHTASLMGMYLILTQNAELSYVLMYEWIISYWKHGWMEDWKDG